MLAVVSRFFSQLVTDAMMLQLTTTGVLRLAVADPAGQREAVVGWQQLLARQPAVISLAVEIEEDRTFSQYYVDHRANGGTVPPLLSSGDQPAWPGVPAAVNPVVGQP